MVFLFYNKWLLRLLVLLTGGALGVVAAKYVGLLAQKLPETGARDALSIVAFLIAGWLAMLIAEVLDNHYARVAGCLCVALGGFVAYPWLFRKDGPQLLKVEGGAEGMQLINLGFWAAMAIAGLMLVLLVTRLILDKLNLGRLPAAVSSAQMDKLLAKISTTDSGAAAATSAADAAVAAGIEGANATPREAELPPIPVDLSPLAVTSLDALSPANALGSEAAKLAVLPRNPAPVSRLSGIGGMYVGRSFVLSPGENTVGRQDALILLADDSQVSRRHAAITLADDGLATVNDLGSTNGSFLNDTRIDSSIELQPGDVLRFGTSLFKVEA
jgi:hypothetical protein